MVREPSAAPLLRAEDVSKTFRQGISQIHALQDASVELWPGETLGLVGESGSGKTTFARVLLGITKPDPESGRARRPRACGHDGAALPRRHPLDPDRLPEPRPGAEPAARSKRSVGRALERLADLHGRKRDDRMLALTRSVRLADRYLSVRPASLSGGLKQRVAIASGVRR